MTTTGQAPVYGPEVWRTDAGVEWSYWDLWFAVLCVHDHGGDWDGLDAAIAARHSRLSRSDGEAKWSHLLDLRERLDATGRSAGELAAAVADRKVITRARAKVLKQGLPGRAMTPAMCNPPSARLEDRARYGWWPGFPASPREPYNRLVTLLGLDDHHRGGWATRDLAYDLADAADRMESGDGPRTLAVRRAVLTIGLDLVECCDDSYGHLGDVLNEAVDTYAGTDWRPAGVAPTVFWPDFLEILIMLSNYGAVHGREAAVFHRAGVAQDPDVVANAAAGLHADYTAARMTWHAGQVRALHVHATSALDRSP